MNHLKVINENGIPFNVVIRPEQPCDGCEKFVVIYDDRNHNGYDWKEFGRPVSSYYISTILSHRENQGINLEASVPDWTLSAENVATIKEFIKNEEKV